MSHKLESAQRVVACFGFYFGLDLHQTVNYVPSVIARLNSPGFGSLMRTEPETMNQNVTSAVVH